MTESNASSSKSGPGTHRLRNLFLGPFVFAVVCALILWVFGWWSRREPMATFSIDPCWTIDVYAEGEFTYEPPGYIYFELKQWGQVRVPRRRFMGIGPERVPRQRFTHITSGDNEVVALLLNNEVQMIHEFSSGYTWPGPYTNVSQSQWEMAELLLAKLRVDHPDIRCPRQIQYGRQLDRSASD